MNMTNPSSKQPSKLSHGLKQGLVKEILLIIVALIILGYFGFDFQRIFESDLVQKNLNYVWEGVKNVWYWILNFFGF